MHEAHEMVLAVEQTGDRFSTKGGIAPGIHER